MPGCDPRNVNTKGWSDLQGQGWCCCAVDSHVFCLVHMLVCNQNESYKNFIMTDNHTGPICSANLERKSPDKIQHSIPFPVSSIHEAPQPSPKAESQAGSGHLLHDISGGPTPGKSQCPPYTHTAWPARLHSKPPGQHGQPPSLHHQPPASMDCPGLGAAGPRR